MSRQPWVTDEEREWVRLATAAGATTWQIAVFLHRGRTTVQRLRQQLVPPRDWAAARVRYESGTIAREIAAELGVTPDTVYWHVRTEGWSRHRPGRPPSEEPDTPVELPPVPRDATLFRCPCGGMTTADPTVYGCQHQRAA